MQRVRLQISARARATFYPLGPTLGKHCWRGIGVKSRSVTANEGAFPFPPATWKRQLQKPAKAICDSLGRGRLGAKVGLGRGHSHNFRNIRSMLLSCPTCQVAWPDAGHRRLLCMGLFSIFCFGSARCRIHRAFARDRAAASCWAPSAAVSTTRPSPTASRPGPRRARCPAGCRRSRRCRRPARDHSMAVPGPA
ncbi:hypothetical protein ACVIW0_004544 [Bradyrhizobium sp. USDA 4454]